jgi:hypothetical protein
MAHGDRAARQPARQAAPVQERSPLAPADFLSGLAPAPAQVLSMQQSAGNGLTTSWLAADPAAAREGLRSVGSTSSPTADVGSPAPVVTAFNRAALRQAGGSGLPAGWSDRAAPASPMARSLSQGAQADRRRFLQPTQGEQLADLERTLLQDFERRAVALTFTWLQANESVAKRESTRYGQPGAAEPERADATQLREAARVLAPLHQKVLARLEEVGNAAAERTSAPMARPTADRYDDHVEAIYGQTEDRELRLLVAEFNLLRRAYGRRFPVLLNRNTDFSQLAEASTYELTTMVMYTTYSVLLDITQLRELLSSTPAKVWLLEPAVRATKLAMGIAPDASSPAGHAIDEHRATIEADAHFLALATGALSLLFGVAAIALTLGAAAPAVAAVEAAILTGTSALLTGLTAGIGVAGAVGEYEQYELQHAAFGASLDPRTALANEDPSFAPVALAILGAVADVGSAVGAVRALVQAARLASEARDLEILARIARAHARALAERGALRGTEEEFVEAVLASARRSISGTATNTIMHGDFAYRLRAQGPWQSVREATDEMVRRGFVEIPEDVLVKIETGPGDNSVWARYLDLPGKRPADDIITWNELFAEVPPSKNPVSPLRWTTEPFDESTEFIVITVQQNALRSDELYAAVLRHEMHEIEGLRRAFAEAGGQMTVGQLRAWIRGLHDEAEALMPEVAQQVRAANAVVP